LGDGVTGGDPVALRRLDRAVRARVLVDPVVRIKIWTPSGRIVYSDERRLIGQRYPLGDEELAALRGGRVAAAVSDLRHSENRYERNRKKLLEVYLPVRTPSGRLLLVETYMRFSSVAASGRRIWTAFAPALLAALVLLWLTQIPLALSLARRLRSRQREREELLVRAIEASDIERRRLAADLHDGPVQDLAGISFSLGTAAGDLRGATQASLQELLERAARVTRESMRQLRSLLVELYPPNLHSAGLESALTDLAAPLRSRGVEVELQLLAPASAPAEVEQLVFRTAQEALRNVLDHANARHVKIALIMDEGPLRLEIRDDGRGFDPNAVAEASRQGHVGLVLLRDRAADLGGVLTVQSEPGAGTTVALRVPGR
jgi:signal transduction histidine kinase